MRKKIFLVLMCIFITLLLLTTSFSYKFTNDSYKNMLEERLKSNCLMFKSLSKNMKTDNMVYLIKDLSKELSERITLINTNGKVLYDSSADYNEMDNHLSRQEIKKAIKDGFGSDVRNSTTMQKPYMYAAMKLSSDNIIRLSVPIESSKINLRNISNQILLSFLILLLISILFAYYFANNITGPIEEMTNASKDIANGNLGRRLLVKSNDELGTLADVFNKMTEKLVNTIDDIKDKNGKLEAVLEGMDGIIAVDTKKKIIMINDSAYDLFNIKHDAMNSYLVESIRNMDLEEKFNNVLSDGKQTTFEIEIEHKDKKVVGVFITPMRKDSQIIGAVALIHDLTELKKLETMRSDFVANVSHELKTPLTSIKGFVETLQAGAINNKENAEKFLNIISMETDRLTRLINDILSLSSIESQKNNVPHDKIKLIPLTEEIIEIMTPYANTKCIKLSLEYNKRSIVVKGNKDRIKQMIINLIDNGIKYTPNGGYVKIDISEKMNNIIINIKDNGIGIAQEHTERIFERFYRVDKGRSRSLGGTGLGLAIVKHIVQSMNGDINVISKLGEGTQFIIDLPLE